MAKIDEKRGKKTQQFKWILNKIVYCNILLKNKTRDQPQTRDPPQNHVFEKIEEFPRYWRKHNAWSLDIALIFHRVFFVDVSFSGSFRYFYTDESPSKTDKILRR